MRKLLLGSASLIGIIVCVAADAPATQPAPPHLLGILSRMPSNIWISQDTSAPGKYGHEPDRLKWCMAQFPSHAKTYGVDSFTGVAQVVGKINNRKADSPYQTEVTTGDCVVCGQTFRFSVMFLSSDPPQWSTGQTVTVSGPAMFWEFTGFTKSKPDALNHRTISVVIHPELEPGLLYEAPIILKQMGQ
jgi:hypothetical protein